MRLPSNHPLCVSLCTFLQDQLICSTTYWFPVAEQVLNCLYALSEHPDQLSGDIIKAFATMAFKSKEQEK